MTGRGGERGGGERIAAAAIKRGDVVWQLPAPNRHHNVIHLMAESGLPTPISGVQGFVTDGGRFVDRVEGLQIAKDAGQIIRECGDTSQLYSENLW